MVTVLGNKAVKDIVNKEKTKNTDDEDDKVMMNDEYQSIDYTIPKYPV